MSAAIVPIRRNVDDLWAVYCALATRLQREPMLASDAAYMVGVLRAHREWAAAFNEVDAA